MKINIVILLLLHQFVYADLHRDNTKNIVISSSLMWEDTKNNQTKHGSLYDASQYCQNLKLAGFKDWRLPSIYELKSIIDKNKVKKNNSREDYNPSTRIPAIKKPFKYALSDIYWTSEMAKSSYYAWRVCFSFGDEYTMHVGSDQPYVRCVRRL